MTMIKMLLLTSLFGVSSLVAATTGVAGDFNDPYTVQPGHPSMLDCYQCVAGANVSIRTPKAGGEQSPAGAVPAPNGTDIPVESAEGDQRLSGSQSPPAPRLPASTP